MFNVLRMFILLIGPTVYLAGFTCGIFTKTSDFETR